MAFKRLNLGPLGISVTANEHAAGLHVSFGGSTWRDFARGVKERRAKGRGTGANGSAGTSITSHTR